MPTHTLETLQAKIEEVYLVKDPYITEVMAACVIAHFLSSDPCWVVIVAPSGGAKSEFVNLVHRLQWTPKKRPDGGEPEAQRVLAMSTLTSKTFLSGMKSTGRDTSLLLQITNGIITFKDLTSLLSEHKDERALIMAQLREIYDGKYAKSFGTGETIEWAGKITLIAGATYAIHTMKAAYTAMGERFIFYNMEQPDRIAAAKRTMENQEEGKMQAHRLRLAKHMETYLTDVLDHMPEDLVKIDPALQHDLLDLAELATRARSDVQRNWMSREQEIQEVHPPEMPTRFAGQLQTIARALMVIAYHETGTMALRPHHRKILIKLALDSITRTRRIAMTYLAQYDTLDTPGLATKLGMPTNSVRRWLEDLAALDIAVRVKSSKSDKWRITDTYRDLIVRYEGVEHEATELIGPAESEEADVPTPPADGSGPVPISF